MTIESFNYSFRQVSDALVVALEGRLGGPESDRLHEALSGLIGDGRIRVVLDCVSLSYTSSAGLRCFLTLAKQLRRGGGQCRFARLTPQVRQLFDLAGFLTVLDVHESLESALQ